MSAIKAMVQNGRIETDRPLDLPDGTDLLVRPQSEEDADDGWDNTPEGINAWLKWYDSLQPLIFTDGELETLKQDRSARKEWELTHADERFEK